MVLKTNPEYQTPTYDELCSKKQTNEIVNNSLEQTDSTVNKSLKITCDLCRVTCNSQQMFNTHIAGKRHQTKLREGVVSSFEFIRIKSSFLFFVN